MVQNSSKTSAKQPDIARLDHGTSCASTETWLAIATIS